MFENKNVEIIRQEKLQKNKTNAKKIKILKENNNEAIRAGNTQLEGLIGKNTTKYGKFVSSYFAWIGLSRQKERANELNDMTRNKLNGSLDKQD